MSILSLSLVSTVAKIAGITSSGIFAGNYSGTYVLCAMKLTLAGYTLSLSDAAVPAIMVAPEILMVQQWRIQYLRGFMVSSLSLLLPSPESAKP